jgi:hypothetical protein
VAAANAARSYLFFQNVSDTDMWINFGTAAVKDQPSIKVAAGQAYSPAFVHTGALNVICGSGTKSWTCKEA